MHCDRPRLPDRTDCSYLPFRHEYPALREYCRADSGWLPNPADISQSYKLTTRFGRRPSLEPTVPGLSYCQREGPALRGQRRDVDWPSPTVEGVVPGQKLLRHYGMRRRLAPATLIPLGFRCGEPVRAVQCLDCF